MKFHDRRDAGGKLARALKKYEGDPNVILLALPRGGVVVADEIAKALKLPIDLVVPRKIGSEHNPEFAIGAITESGHVVWSEVDRAVESPEYLKRKIDEEKVEAERRLAKYRGDRPPRDIEGKIVIIVDDGVATGLTMKAAIETVKSEKPSRIIVAVPHGAAESLGEIEKLVDEVLALERPAFYGAVGAFYDVFDQTEDDEVVNIMRRS